MGRAPPEVQRELEELVPEYRPEAGVPLGKRFARGAARFVAGAVLAVAAMATIFYILHKHLTDAQTAPPPKKPVIIQILPAQK